jgi:hypothetical protein
MASRRLTDDERTELIPLLTYVREVLVQLSAGDAELHWAFRWRLSIAV